MKIILKEIVQKEAKVVWNGSFAPHNDNDKNAILDEAFDLALCNYILKLYPEGFGLNSKVNPFNDDGKLSRAYHCSGRNVRMQYNEGEIVIDDHSRKDRDFILEVEQD